MDRLGETKDQWSADRIQLDRRLLIVERISDDLLERVKTTNSAIDSYFASSKQIKSFEAVCLDVQGLS